MTEKKKWRIGGPLTPLVPPGKEKGDALPPESMKLRAQILAEDARRKAERQKKVPGAVPAGPPEPAPIEGVLESMWTPLPLVELILQGQTALGRLAALSHLDDSVMNLEEAAAMLMRVALEIEMITVSKMDLKEKVG